MIGQKTMKWASRIYATAIFVFGVVFYLGYGTLSEHIPFINPGYTLWDNIWLTIFPVAFTGLILGWRFPKTGGWLTTIFVAAGLLMGFLLQGEIVSYMLAPLSAGILYLITGHMRDENKQKKPGTGV